MADDAQLQNSEDPSPVQDPLHTAPSPVPPGKKEKVGSLVERLRSYESDVARLKGVKLAPVVPDKEVKLVPKPVKPPTPIPAGQNPLDIPAPQTLDLDEPLPEEPAIALNPSGIAGKPEEYSYIENPGKTVETINATNTLVSDVVKEDPQKAIDALHKETPIQNFRTIETDVATAREQKKKPEAQDFLSVRLQQHPVRPVAVEDPKRSFYLLMLSGILIGGGLLGFAGYYVVKNRPKPAPTIVVDQKVIFPTELTKNLVITSSSTLISAIVAERSEPLGERNQIIRFNVMIDQSPTPLTGEGFATLLSPTIPSWLTRSFGPVYLAGLHNSATGWQPLMIFKVDSYENGYAGMLKWEETMADEFKPFFPQRTVRVATASSTTSTTTKKASSTPITTSPIITSQF
jgi:hypothetical protein